MNRRRQLNEQASRRHYVLTVIIAHEHTDEYRRSSHCSCSHRKSLERFQVCIRCKRRPLNAEIYQLQSARKVNASRAHQATFARGRQYAWYF